MTFKTTEAQFAQFQDSVKRWVDFFGLKSYEVFFRHNDKHSGTVATLEADSTSRNATFTLKKTWPYPPTDEEIDKCGFHECCELLLDTARDFAEARHPTGNWEDINHTIIRQLENSVWERFKPTLDTINNSDKL